MLKKRNITFYDKSFEEIEYINKSKGRSFIELKEKYGIERAIEIISSRTSNLRKSSKESEIFFSDLDRILSDELSEQCMYAPKCNEWWIRSDEDIIFVDFRLGHVIIEYHGDFWHSNPKKVIPTDIHPVLNISHQKIWEKDLKRKEIIEKMGFSYLVIWSEEVNIDRNSALNKCKEFIDEHRRDF